VYRPDDLVVIGGGAEATNRPPNGALLTASYSGQNLSAWLVSSKDHERPQPHFLKVYAIGLKIARMTRDALPQHIHIGRSVSELAQHPEASESVPPAGELVTASIFWEVNEFWFVGWCTTILVQRIDWNIYGVAKVLVTAYQNR
jgi:hypothetical protein